MAILRNLSIAMSAAVISLIAGTTDASSSFTIASNAVIQTPESGEMADSSGLKTDNSHRLADMIKQSKPAFDAIDGKVKKLNFSTAAAEKTQSTPAKVALIKSNAAKAQTALKTPIVFKSYALNKESRITIASAVIDKPVHVNLISTQMTDAQRDHRFAEMMKNASAKLLADNSANEKISAPKLNFSYLQFAQNNQPTLSSKKMNMAMLQTLTKQPVNAKPNSRTIPANRKFADDAADDEAENKMIHHENASSQNTNSSKIDLAVTSQESVEPDPMQPQVKVVQGDPKRNEFFILDASAKDDAPLNVAAKERVEEVAVEKSGAIAQSVMASSSMDTKWYDKQVKDKTSEPTMFKKAEEAIKKMVASAVPPHSVLTPNQEAKLKMASNTNNGILANRTLIPFNSKKDRAQGEFAPRAETRSTATLASNVSGNKEIKLALPMLHMANNTDNGEKQPIHFKHLSTKSTELAIQDAMDNHLKMKNQIDELKRSLIAEEMQTANPDLKLAAKSDKKSTAKFALKKLSNKQVTLAEINNTTETTQASVAKLKNERKVAIKKVSASKPVHQQLAEMKSPKKPTHFAAKQTKVNQHKIASQYKVKEYADMVGHSAHRPSVSKVKKPGRIRFVIKPYEPNVEFSVNHDSQSQTDKHYKRWSSADNARHMAKHSPASYSMKTKYSNKRIPKMEFALSKPHPYQ